MQGFIVIKDGFIWDSSESREDKAFLAALKCKRQYPQCDVEVFERVATVRPACDFVVERDV